MSKTEYGESDPAEKLLKSAYEVARDERLKRNREVLAQLGLSSSSSSVAEAPAPVGKKSKKRATATTREEPSRRSKRKLGQNPEGVPVSELQEEQEQEMVEEKEEDEIMRRKIERLKSLHQERNTAYKNPTATYEHTWMRVRTMSDKALENRIKVIENAKGQHCIVKMQMFAEVLLLALKTDLALKATASLNRLLECVRDE